MLVFNVQWNILPVLAMKYTVDWLKMKNKPLQYVSLPTASGASTTLTLVVALDWRLSADPVSCYGVNWRGGGEGHPGAKCTSWPQHSRLTCTGTGRAGHMAKSFSHINCLWYGFVISSGATLVCNDEVLIYNTVLRLAEGTTFWTWNTMVVMHIWNLGIHHGLAWYCKMLWSVPKTSLSAPEVVA